MYQAVLQVVQAVTVLVQAVVQAQAQVVVVQAVVQVQVAVAAVAAEDMVTNGTP